MLRLEGHPVDLGVLDLAEPRRIADGAAEGSRLPAGPPRLPPWSRGPCDATARGPDADGEDGRGMTDRRVSARDGEAGGGGELPASGRRLDEAAQLEAGQAAQDGERRDARGDGDAVG